MSPGATTSTSSGYAPAASSTATVLNHLAARARRARADRPRSASRCSTSRHRRPSGCSTPRRCSPPPAAGRRMRGGARRTQPRIGVYLASPERPRLELLGQRLPAREGPADLRHPRVELRSDQPAGGAAPPVPRHLREQHTCDPGAVHGARHSRRSRQRCGSRRYVTGATTDHLTPWKGCYRTTQLLGGPQHVRAEQRRPHREPRQPARQPKGALLRRPRTRARPRAVAGRVREASRHVVGALGRLGARAIRRSSASPGQGGQPQVPADRAGSGCIRTRSGTVSCLTPRPCHASSGRRATGRARARI